MVSTVMDSTSCVCLSDLTTGLLHPNNYIKLYQHLPLEGLIISVLFTLVYYLQTAINTMDSTSNVCQFRTQERSPPQRLRFPTYTVERFNYYCLICFSLLSTNGNYYTRFNLSCLPISDLKIVSFTSTTTLFYIYL